MKVHRTLCSPASPVEGSEHKEAREDGSAALTGRPARTPAVPGGNRPGSVLPDFRARAGRRPWMA